MKKTFLLSIFLISIFSSYSQNTWIAKTNFGGTSRDGAVGFSIGTKGYIGLGFDINGLCQDLWEWDQSTNAWAQKAAFTGIPRAFAVGFSIGTKGYIGTGCEVSSPYTSYKDFWEWDQSTNTWTQRANFAGTPRNGAVGFSIGGKGYLGGGADTSYFRDFWEYDPTSDSWTQKTNFGGNGRWLASGFSIGTKGYLGTGYDSTGNANQDFWEWDQGTNAWTSKTNFGGGLRAEGIGFSIGAKGYLGTGQNNSGNRLNDFWEYDPSSNSWSSKANFGGTGRVADAGFSIGTKGYIGTGFDNSSFRNDFYEYTPSPAGIEEYFQVSANIFPNPFSSSATFDLSKELRNAELKLFDVTGKEVRSINFSGKEIILQREDLESGIYFYQVSSENKIVSSGKLIVE